jgi:phytoene synthase
VVGLVTIRIFGYRDPAAEPLAEKVGIAFQLTNIIRDVGEDALRGRIYLPIQELQRFDVKAHELLKRGIGAEPSFPQRFAALMAFQIERALATYDEAIALLPSADRRAQKPGLMMASIYRTLLREIAREPALVLTQRVGLTPLRKFWLAWKMQALGRF